MATLKRPIIALAGNPNTGKSTVFNALTGLKQHTGNWPGKTVTLAVGSFSWHSTAFTIVDLPGTYSLFANSPDEEVARDFILFNVPDVTVVVVDACSLERNLNLVLQVLEITSKAVVCVNLMDEARRRRLAVDTDQLALELGVPAIPCIARAGEGLSLLKDAIFNITHGHIATSPRSVYYNSDIETSLKAITFELTALAPKFSVRWLALRLLERDDRLLQHFITEKEGSAATSAPIITRTTKKVAPWLS